MLLVVLVTFVVGVRLLLAARSTRGVAELGLGVGFVTGSLGSALPEVGQRVLWETGSATAQVVAVVGAGLVVLGTIALYLTTWRIFRPNSSWARNASLVGAAGALASLVLRLADGGLGSGQMASPGVLVYLTDRIALFAWFGCESLVHYGFARRRLASDAGDPVMTYRVLVWGLASLGMVAVLSTFLLVGFSTGRHPFEFPLPMAFVTLLALAISAATWCAFFPPEPLRLRLRAQAA